MATVQDLVEFLRETAHDLEYNYDPDTPLKLSANTYRMSQHILGTDEGFVDLNNPVEEEMKWPEPDENLDEYGRDFEDVAEE